MTRYLDTCFRLRWLWLAASSIWLGLVLLILTTYRPEYEVVARLRVQEPLLQLIGPRLEQPGTATAWYHVQAMSSLIQSDTFMLRVLEQTPWRDALATPTQQNRTLTYVTRRLSVIPVTGRLLEVRFVSDRPDAAPPLINALAADAIKARIAIDQEQIGLALDFYRVYLLEAEETWLNALAALRDGMVRNPSFADALVGETYAPSPARDSVSALEEEPDPEREQQQSDHVWLVKRLADREEHTRRAYDQWRSTVEALQYTLSAREASAARSLTVVDPPVTTPRQMSLWEVVGLRIIAVTIFILAACLAIIWMVTWTDSSVRSQVELAQVVDLPTLGGLPIAGPRGRRRLDVRRLFLARPA